MTVSDHTNSEGRVAPAARPSRVRAAGADSPLVAAAPWLFLVLWSTEFVGARYGTEDAGPLTFLTIRFALAAGKQGSELSFDSIQGVRSRHPCRHRPLPRRYPMASATCGQKQGSVWPFFSCDDGRKVTR